LRAIASHNVHESVGKYQEGGTAVLSYGNLLQQFDPEGSSRDDLGLGRWTYMRFIREDRIVTRVICGYSPCANKKKDSGTVYQQHRRHLISKLKDDTCPRARFWEDLLRQMKQWWKDCERLILCSDANENIYQGELGRQLTELNGLSMKEVVSWGYVFSRKRTYQRVLDHRQHHRDERMRDACRVRSRRSPTLCYRFCHHYIGRLRHDYSGPSRAAQT
jgi:hypothetical protein